jgi:hypothetical protein
MDRGVEMIDEITKILREFALTKFPVKVLEVKGPVQEKGKYRWRIVSTRYKDVTVVLKTKKSLFQKLGVQAIQVWGTTEDRVLKPNLDDLRTYLETAQLLPV